MSIVLQLGQKKDETYLGKNVIGFTFNATLTATLVNVALNDKKALLDTSKIQVKAILKRKKRAIVIAQDNLKNLALASGFHDNRFFDGYFMVDRQMCTDITLQGVATKAVVSVNVEVDLRSIINLRSWKGYSPDELYFEVTFGSDALGADVSTGTDTFLSCDIVEGVGLETRTPQIKSYSIPASESTFVKSLGDNVDSVYILSTFPIAGGVATNSLNGPLDQMSFDADKISFVDSVTELVAKRKKGFHGGLLNNGQGWLDDAGARDSNFCLVNSPVELHDVQLNLTLDGSKVIGSQNSVVWYTFELDPEVLDRSKKKNAEFASINRAKLMTR